MSEVKNYEIESLKGKLSRLRFDELHPELPKFAYYNNNVYYDSYECSFYAIAHDGQKIELDEKYIYIR